MATEAAFKPFEYVDNGKIVGFGSDLLAEVAKDLGVEVEQLDLPFQGILAGLAAGQYDLVATSVAINPERVKTYAFSRPFAAISNVIVVPVGDTKVTSIGDLNGIVVGTQLGSSTEAVARQINDELKAGGGAGFSDLRLFQTFPDTAFVGRVTKIANSAAALSATGQSTDRAVDFEVEVTLENPPADVRPDLSMTARIITDVRDNVLSIPIIALTARAHTPTGDAAEAQPLADSTGGKVKEREGVFVVENGIAMFRPVRVGIAGDEHFEVLEGLREGETIVSGSYQAIRDLADSTAVKKIADQPAGTTP